MAKFLVLWEADDSKIPLDPNIRREAWLAAIKLTRDDMKAGITKDWGAFAGTVKGFTISEGTAEQVHEMIVKYVPYFRFQIIPLISLDSAEAAIKTIK